jgi:hypothetical protein
MTTEKQLEANRQNAQKSTGPKTEEGKKRASLNGRRHGLTGQAFIMSEEDRKAWETFSQAFIETLKPANPVEAQFAYLIAKDNYRINRIHAIEENTFSLGHAGLAGNIEADHFEVHNAFTQANVFRIEAKTFQNISLYESRLTRNMHKNMKMLQELQAQRKAEEEQAAREKQRAEDRAALAAALKPRTKTTPQPSPSSPTRPPEPRRHLLPTPKSPHRNDEKHPLPPSKSRLPPGASRRVCRKASNWNYDHPVD